MFSNLDFDKVQKIIDNVRGGYIQSIVTDTVPNIGDVLSAHIILSQNNMPISEVCIKFGSVYKWLKDLKKRKQDWEDALQDILFLVKNT